MMESYTDHARRAALRATAETVGRPPTVMEYREHAPADAPSSETVRAHFRDRDRPWLAALTDAGLDPDLGRHGGRSGVSEYEAAETYAQVSADCGAWASPDQYRDAGALPSVPTLYGLFGSWSALRDAAEERYPRLARLIDDGPVPLSEYDDYNNLDRRLGVLKYRQHGCAVVVYLPGHTPAAVAEAFAESNPRSAFPKHVKRTGVDEMTTAVTEELVGMRNDQ